MSWITKCRQLGTSWPGIIVTVVAAAPTFQPFGIPCLWKAYLLRGPHFSVRPLAQSGERSTATHGPSKRQNPSPGSAEGRSGLFFPMLCM